MKKLIHYIHSHFKTKLSLYFFVSGFVPLLLVAILMYPVWNRILREKEQLSMERKISTINSTLDQIVSDIEKNMSYIFTNRYILDTVSQGGRLPKVESFYRIVTVESILKSISSYSLEKYAYTLIDHTGQIYTNGSALNLLEDFDGALCNAIKKVSAGQIYFTVRRAYSVDRKKTLTFARPLYVDGEIQAVMIVDVAPELLETQISPYDDEDYMILVTAGDEEPVYMDPSMEQFCEERDMAFVFQQQISLTADGVRYARADGWSAASRFHTCILVPEDLLFRDSIYMRWRIVAVFLIIIFQTLIFSRIAAGNLSEQIVLINQEIQRFIRTRKKMEPVSGKRDEIQEIADGIQILEDEIEIFVEQIQDDERKKRQLEFKVLQQQVNPHMLYNTLNTITKLAQFQGVRNIEEICHSFTNMLQIISKIEGDFITIRQEIDFIRDYVTLKRYNSYHEYNLYLDIQEEMYGQPILKLLLHTLVENSIRHGFTNLMSSGDIYITIHEEDGRVCIILRDNGNGIPPGRLQVILAPEKQGMSDVYASTGIRNCMERLRLEYGDSQSMEIKSNGESGTMVRITYPMRGNNDSKCTFG